MPANPITPEEALNLLRSGGLVRATKAARVLGVHADTVRRHVHDGLLQGTFIGRSVYVLSTDPKYVMALEAIIVRAQATALTTAALTKG